MNILQIINNIHQGSLWNDLHFFQSIYLPNHTRVDLDCGGGYIYLYISRSKLKLPHFRVRPFRRSCVEMDFKIYEIPKLLAHTISVVTVRKRSCGKVMFLHLSVILFTGGVVSQQAMRGCVHPLNRHPHWANTPLGKHALPGQTTP